MAAGGSQPYARLHCVQRCQLSFYLLQPLSRVVEAAGQDLQVSMAVRVGKCDQK
jgi:hypothetical protein